MQVKTRATEKQKYKIKYNINILKGTNMYRLEYILLGPMDVHREDLAPIQMFKKIEGDAD